MADTINDLLDDTCHVVLAARRELVVVGLVPAGGAGEHDVVAVAGEGLVGAERGRTRQTRCRAGNIRVSSMRCTLNESYECYGSVCVCM